MNKNVLFGVAAVEAVLIIIVVVVGGALAIARPHDLPFASYVQDVMILAAALGFAGIAAAAVYNGKEKDKRESD